jgi:hypothetical protein
MDQLPTPVTVQPEIPSTSVLDPASGAMAQLIAVEGSLGDI